MKKLLTVTLCVLSISGLQADAPSSNVGVTPAGQSLNLAVMPTAQTPAYSRIGAKDVIAKLESNAQQAQNVTAADDEMSFGDIYGNKEDIKMDLPVFYQKASTPLHTAVKNNDIEAVKAILANPTDTTIRDNKGKSASDYAVANSKKLLSLPSSTMKAKQISDLINQHAQGRTLEGSIQELD